MKRKLSIAFTLIALSLVGIIVFQGYWTVNAYRVNKVQFDNDIDSAMLRAMDDCKKDYFDSIRVVMIKKLSPPDFIIRIDTITERDPTNTTYEIRVADQFQSSNMMLNSPFIIRKPYLDFYKAKINFIGKESIPALVTETSFYVPDLLSRVMWAFEIADMNGGFKRYKVISDSTKKEDSLLRQTAQTVLKQQNPDPFASKLRDTITQRKLAALFKARREHPLPSGDTTFKHKIKQLIVEQRARLSIDQKARLAEPPPAKESPKPVDTSIKHNISLLFKEQRMRQMPPNYHQADSIKMYKYLKRELAKASITAPFTLVFNHKDTTAKTFRAGYSETMAFPYQYHGFAFLQQNRIDRIITYTKAVFKTPQYAIMKNMMVNLTLSLLLILLTGFCFLYVYRTIVEQKNLAALKDDFINNMTHELKTPIATIAVAIEGLQNFNALSDPEKTQRYLQTSREQLERLNQLVTKVLNVAAFEDREIDLNIQQVNIDEMIKQITSSEKMKAVKVVNFTYENKSQLEYIAADKLHLNNVLLNLVDNAIKYSGDVVDVAISVYRYGSNLCFSVKDNGLGISSEHIDHVFDKFYRVPTGNVHNVKGTGLGLSYVKYIVEAHGGSINVISNAPAGTEFIVTLPLANG